MGHVDFLVAAVALVVLDYGPLEQLFQTLIKALLILHLHGQVVDRLESGLCMAARLAGKLGALTSLEDVLEQVLLRGWCQHFLKAIEEVVEELLGVALDANVGGTDVVWVFEGVAEACCVVVTPGRQFEEAKDSLELPQ